MDDEIISHACAKDIMTPFVHMLHPMATLKEILEIMVEKQVSAVFIDHKQEHKYFIVSQTDVIKFLHQEGINDPLINLVPASRIMKGPIEVIEEDMSIDLVIRFMKNHNYKRVLIGKEGTATGVISTRDILIWNDVYFKPARPQVLLFIENQSSLLIGKHFFKENIEQGSSPDNQLIELYGGALSSISMITDEVLKQTGKMKHLLKENRAVLFENKENITGILICDNNSIDMRTKLHRATARFIDLNQKYIKNNYFSREFDVRPIISVFKEQPKDILTKVQEELAKESEC